MTDRVPLSYDFREVASADTAKSGLALVTANFGGIDKIRSFPAQHGISAFYYTEANTLSATDAATAASWTRVMLPDYPRHDMVPRLRAKYFKLQIHRLPEVEPYRWLAWGDASLQFNDLSFLFEFCNTLALLPDHQRVALIPHPHRSTIRQEYEFVQNEIAAGDEYLRVRYGQEKMTEQMSYFLKCGWNLDAPLWCGTTWLVENNEVIRRCWNGWWDQILRYGMQDQLSLPVLLDAFGLQAQSFGFDLTDNPFFKWEPHQVVM